MVNSKNLREHVTVWTGVLELFIVGGLFYGWPTYVFVLKEERVFYEVCNQTIPVGANVTDEHYIPQCVEQDKVFNLLFLVGCLLGNGFALVYGFILDKFGLFICRICVNSTMSLGLILMIFYQDRILFSIGLELISIAAIGTLITNLTIQPIWPKRASTVGSIYSGTFDSSSAMLMLAKVLYDYCGMSLTTIQIGLAVLSIIQWLRTFLLLPMTIVPRELPDNYDLKEHTLLYKKKICGNDKIDAIGMDTVDTISSSSNEKMESHSSVGESDSMMKEFINEVMSIKMLSIAVWYSIVTLRVNAYQAWYNPSLEWMFPGDIKLHSKLTNIFGASYILSLVISPTIGLIIDWFANRSRKMGNDPVRGRAIGIAFVSGGCSILASVISLLAVFRGSFGIAITNQFLFCLIRPFFYTINAQAAFMLFPNHLFGMVYGFLNVINGLATLLADPIFRLIHGSLNGNYAPVHYAMAVACFLTLIHPFVLLRSTK